MSRLDIARHAAEAYRAVADLDAVATRELDPELVDLVKLRASQINGCAFCVDMHSTDLGARGTGARKIAAVAVWREAPFFSERERAALALTEEITLLPAGVDDATWDAAAAVYSERELSLLVLAIGTINIWNRIAVPTRMTPPAE